MASTSGHVPSVTLAEEQDAQRLADWMNAEDEVMQKAVDGGDFGRPIVPSGILRWWDGLGQWCRAERSRELLGHSVFAGRVDDVACGHVEVAVLRAIDVSHNPVNTFCGIEPFALLLYLYVLPQRRGAGVGAEMVRLACEDTLRRGVKQVVLIVQETNVRARRFYERAGFQETGSVVEKMGSPFKLISFVGTRQ
mmetsp:Transcript_58687/g.156220  ORF Transcript_58687/g.156220 Transcript_58687/m.156220 type:complete len:194 (-) Transcript_58687:26-607(-)